MADVYTARDQRLNRDVALKLLAPHYADDPVTIERFRREAQAVAAFSQPNVVSIYDSGSSEGQPYLVMQLIAGPDLREHLRRTGPLGEGKALALATQIAAALEAAHSRGVVHRDIKPGNVLLDGHGRAKVADFGIARPLGAAAITRTAAVIGTAHYLAPEQVMGHPPAPICIAWA
jgi:serine/threonine-protein kinase